MKLLYDKAAAADVLSTTERRIDELRCSGLLVAVVDAGEFRYRLDDLRTYVHSLRAWRPGDNAPQNVAGMPFERVAAVTAAPGYLPPPPPHAVTDSPWITRPELAGRLRVPATTLAQWAIAGKGPAYKKFGRHVRYRLTDVEDWEQSQDL